MTAILQLARAAPTSDALDADLAQIDKTTLLQNGVGEPFPNPLPPAAQAFLQTATHIEKRAKRIYLYASSMSDFEQTIWSRGIIRDKLFLLKSPQYRGTHHHGYLDRRDRAVVAGIYGLRKPEVCSRIRRLAIGETKHQRDGLIANQGPSSRLSLRKNAREMRLPIRSARR